MTGIRISRNFKKYFLNAQQGKSYFKLIINALNVVWISRKYREILKELNNAQRLFKHISMKYSMKYDNVQTGSLLNCVSISYFRWHENIEIMIIGKRQCCDMWR